MNSKKKVGIALEGGGAKGAYQIGVLKALMELEIEYDCVVGTSIGALNGISYVLKDYENSAELWKKIDFSYSDNRKKSKTSSDIFEKITKNIDKFEKSYLSSTGKDPEPLFDFYREVVREDKMRGSKIEYGLTTYCLTDRKPLKLFKEDIPQGLLHEFVFASCYLPVFTPRPIDGKYYLDGSMFLKLPVEMAVEKGCDVIVAIRLRPEIYDYSGFKGSQIIDIAPDEFLSSTLEASSDRIMWMIEKGYEDAIRILTEKRSMF
ncbi:MAG: patatin-like phospholipase family protein [Sedimentibacter sp.]|uniref:patatin-like phospholipase family protein n=1 Tax=Sedimentibacter sp. TaxID=1960295 RepID=UPI003158B8AC